MNLWDNPGIPHKGWVCIDMEDLGECEEFEEPIYEKCQMCGKEDIRFVHIMKHSEVGILRVGCNCAAKMEEDPSNPRKRDTECKNKASRRKSFLNKQWRARGNGNFTLRYKGDMITIFKDQYGPGFGVMYKGKVKKSHKGEILLDINISKIAAFELFDEYHTTKSADAYIW
jgi:hypothetical protein